MLRSLRSFLLVPASLIGALLLSGPSAGLLAVPDTAEDTHTPEGGDAAASAADSPELVSLGETLFSDPRLSSTGKVSCATCHDPLKSFVDGVKHSVGEQGTPVGRNSPTLVGIGAHDRFVDPLSGQIVQLLGNDVRVFDSNRINMPHLEVTEPQIQLDIEFPIPSHSPIAPPELVAPAEPVAEPLEEELEEEFEEEFEEEVDARAEEDPSGAPSNSAPSNSAPSNDEAADAILAQQAELEAALEQAMREAEPVSPTSVRTGVQELRLGTLIQNDLTNFDPFGKNAISLAERCLSPLGNALEMGADIDTTIGIFRDRADLGEIFDEVFGGPGGITRERVGAALAAYLRSLAIPRTAPFARFLDGDQAALDAQQQRGLALFNGKGACASCHSGESLRDGLVHVTEPTGRPSAGRRNFLRRREQAALEPVPANPVQANPVQANPVQANPIQTITVSTNDMVPIFNAFDGPLGSGYGGLPVNLAATPTLWDVARTAPYFGDGEIETLEAALATHVAELVAVGAITDAPRAEDGALAAGAQVLKALSDRVPEEVRPGADDPRDWPTPAFLTAEERADIEAFLRALSPVAI